MKRVWFAVIFLFVLLVLCFAEQHFINNFYSEMSERVDAAIEYQKVGDGRLESAVEEIKDYWFKNNDLIFTLTNHGVLDMLSADIRSLETSELENDLNEVKAMLNVFYENQRITFANIF